MSFLDFTTRFQNIIVLIHIEIDDNTVLSVIFARSDLGLINIRSTSASDIVRSFPHLIIRDFRNLVDVGRLSVERKRGWHY